MNATTRFLATVSEDEKGATRNVCNELGYESVALIPIRLLNRIFGVIHVADTAENMVPLRLVEILEAASRQAGPAIRRVWAEENMRASEEKWRSLTEHSPSYVMTLDLDGKILFINRTAPGLAREEVIGTSAYDYVADEYQEAMRACFERVLNTGQPDRYEAEYQGTADRPRSYDVRVGPLYRDERIVGFTVSGVDVTERKATEAEIQRQLDELRLWHSVTLDREDRVRQLKREVNELLRRSGAAARYPSQEAQANECHEPADS